MCFKEYAVLKLKVIDTMNDIWYRFIVADLLFVIL
jgi:hypothetical protein